jgi:hypothetical protein
MYSEQIDSFLKEYDENSNLGFDTLKYRTGAPITSSFGLVTGYRKVNNEYIWDTIRHHTGIDRSWGNNGDVYAPFYFNRSEFHDYGPTHVYGSIMRLFNDEYGFEMRIVHMHPKTDILPDILKKLQNKEPIERNTLLGKCGTYGSASSGEHTHTEIISIKEENKLLDIILYRKFGQAVYNNYTEDYIINFYKTKDNFKYKKSDVILSHYNNLIKNRRVVGIVNSYKYEYEDWYYNMEKRTRYSSEHLFNGL